MIVSVINVVNECSQSMRDSYHACSNADVSNLALTDRIRKKNFLRSWCVRRSLGGAVLFFVVTRNYLNNLATDGLK